MKLLIVGCERSGTTIISKLLSQGSGANLLNDPIESWYLYPLIRVIGIRGFSLSMVFKLWKYKIVKVPGFATILPELRKIHPLPYKIVYIVRDPRDNYSAIKERLSQDLNGLYLNIHYLNKKGKSICENISYRWDSYLQFAMDYSNNYKEDILFVRYEDFLKDKIKILQKIAVFSKLNFNSNMITNDLDKQINKSWSNKIYGAGRYKNELTDDEIETVERITIEKMKRFNYI
ncbi:sulfotransferase family protein [Aegicerativicinus sediminis]|uniref:sulfotransferase family protein n=1 Tax=Aegicerativicinus sediminis TaxID=2893202 RepID=UPI001E3B3745|nr:sulfotransferase [Aegicerativicinus sediminis]